ncbi:hypothetical protein SAMN05443248_1784 [Bradyrhizobium erythrophlei]|uniref:Uncharacterized protein n=1 Tax=Bradyrhizobium erythrophlei TaxID=1437360 RepID=A0A1M5KCV6_9BRAD|nr:hypothetical protein SAMN05443248_1784 [Bradyrhizobium erythrophlei]
MRGEGAGSRRRVFSCRMMGGQVDQSERPASFHSVKGMHNLVPVEHREQTVHCSRRVTRAQLNVFPQDAPGVLNGANDRVLVGAIHDATRLMMNFRSR